MLKILNRIKSFTKRYNVLINLGVFLFIFGWIYLTGIKNVSGDNGIGLDLENMFIIGLSLIFTLIGFLYIFFIVWLINYIENNNEDEKVYLGEFVLFLVLIIMFSWLPLIAINEELIKFIFATVLLFVTKEYFEVKSKRLTLSCEDREKELIEAEIGEESFVLRTTIVIMYSLIIIMQFVMKLDVIANQERIKYRIIGTVLLFAIVIATPLIYYLVNWSLEKSLSDKSQ